MSYALIKCPIGSLYNQTVTLSTLEDEVIYGMKVEILEQQSKEWYHIRTHYRYEGWIHSSNLEFNTDFIHKWDLATKAIVKHAYGDVLTENKVQGACLIALPRGAQVQLIGEPDEKGWQEVGLVNGEHGFMKSSFLAPFVSSMYEDDYLNKHSQGFYQESMVAYIRDEFHQTEDVFRATLVKNALSYLKVQYRWGGKTSLGIDCSGLCSMAYMLSGIIIYRDAKIVEGFPLHEITLEQRKPGDLFFFPGHVAMYIGDDRYVHSTNKKGSDGVVINSINPAHSDYREDLLQSMTAVGSIF